MGRGLEAWRSPSNRACAVCLVGQPSNCRVLLRTTKDVGMMMRG